MNICNYKPLRWQANMAPDINNRFRFVYRTLCHLQSSTFEFLYGSNDPLNDPGHIHAIYLNTTDGTIWDWNNTTQIWELIYTPTGGPGGTQDLQSVLDQGNSANNQYINLFGDDSHFFTEATGGLASTDIGVTTEPYIYLKNSLGNDIYLSAALVTGNIVEFPANSGTLALLSDIPPATPTVIVTKTADYTLQLSDADFDTLFEMAAATDEDFIVDSAVAFSIGTSFIFARRGSGEVNILPAGATIILSANGATNLTYKDSGATLIKVSATEWYLFGDIGDPITATPGGNDRELQFNDGGTAFGGATGFTYDPANTNGLVELVSTDDTKSIMSIQGPSTSSNIFEVSDEANPGVGNYFIVGANQGFMAGIWTISNGGELNIATGSLGQSNMLKLTNAVGAKTHALAYTDGGDFSIRDVTNSLDRFSILNNGTLRIEDDGITVGGKSNTLQFISNTSLGFRTANMYLSGGSSYGSDEYLTTFITGSAFYIHSDRILIGGSHSTFGTMNSRALKLITNCTTDGFKIHQLANQVSGNILEIQNNVDGTPVDILTISPTGDVKISGSVNSGSLNTVSSTSHAFGTGMGIPGLNCFGIGESHNFDVNTEASSAIYGYNCYFGPGANDALAGGTGSNVFAVGGIALGIANEVSGEAAAAIGGTANAANADNSAILGGVSNLIEPTATNSVILGGSTMYATDPDTAYVPNLNIAFITEHADNAAAITAGLSVGTVYRTGDLLKIVH